MRALLAIGILIFVAVVAAVTLDLFGPGEVDRLVEEQVDIDDVGGKGPSFDVEMGSMTPGEDGARSAERSEDDAGPADATEGPQENGAKEQSDGDREDDRDGALAAEARSRGPGQPASP